MGYKKIRHPRARLNRYWLALLLALVAGLVISQIVGSQPVFAESEPSVVRDIDRYNLGGGACGTYEQEYTPPGGSDPVQTRFHRCYISQEDHPKHNYHICLDVAQLSRGIATEAAIGEYRYSHSVTLLGGNHRAKSLASQLVDPLDEVVVDCDNRPFGSNTVLPFYKNEFELQCQRPTDDFFNSEFPGLGLLDPSPRLGGSCQLIADLDHNNTRPFAVPNNYERINGWGSLMGCSKKSNPVSSRSAALILQGWHCEVDRQGVVCLEDGGLRGYSYFDHNSYYVKVESVSRLDPDCYEFDSGSITTALYVHCSGLDRTKGEQYPPTALANNKCEMIVFVVSDDLVSGPGPLPPGATFGDVINCTGDCGFLDTVDNFLKWMSYLVVPIVTIVIIIGSIQLSLAGDNPEGIKKAKKRITQAVVALVCYALLWSVLRWLI